MCSSLNPAVLVSPEELSLAIRMKLHLFRSISHSPAWAVSSSPHSSYFGFLFDPSVSDISKGAGGVYTQVCQGLKSQLLIFKVNEKMVAFVRLF